MYEPHDPKLRRLAERLSPAQWSERVACARERAVAFERVRVLVGGGSSARQAIREVFPDAPIEARYSQYVRYAKKGWEGLIDERYVERERKVTPEIEGFVRGLLLGNAPLRSPDLCQMVEEHFGVEMGESTTRDWLRGAGLSAPVGRPSATTAATKAVPLPCAGAELLKAADHETEVTSRLTLDMVMALGGLEPPEGEVRDDREDRDERGRFLASYNEPAPRTEPELGEWEPYGERDRVRSGYLWLNDSKDPKRPLRVRVVGRHRGRSDKLAWFATNAPEDGFPASAIVDAYFGRWPHEEQVYRDANAAVNLDTRYGYGEKKVENIAVLDGIERLDGQIRTAGALASGFASAAQTREDFHSLSVCEDWLTSSRAEAERLAKKATKLEERVQSDDKAIERKRQERARLESRIEVFTVDTELDELLLAYKLTFLNPCAWLLRHCFPGLSVETTTFIEHVPTLPGDRVRTQATETVHIYRQRRDTRFMEHVEKACRLLTERGLLRDDRRLRFEVIDPPG